MKFQKEILSGFKWAFSNNIFQSILLASQYLILARYLEPEDFGVMAALIVIVGLFAVFIEMGIGDAIVQNEGVDQKKISQLLLTSFLFGLVAIVMSNGLGYFILSKIGMSGNGRFLFILSITFLMSPFFFIYSAVLERSLMFKELNQVLIFSFFVGFVTTILLAILDQGIYALVLGYLMNEFCIALGAWLMGRKVVKLSFEGITNSIIPQLKYGSYISGSRIFSYFHSNVDKILIGKFLGDQALGFYAVACNINAIPRRKINSAANSISFPIFSKLKANQEEINKVFDAVMSFVVLLSIPFYLLLMFSGTEIITYLFGEKWTSTGQILEWLSLLGIAKVISNPAGPLILAKGKSSVEMYWNIFWSVIVTGVVYFTLSIDPDIISMTKNLAIAGLIVSPIWHYIVVISTSVSYKNLMGLMAISVFWILLMWLTSDTIKGFSIFYNILMALLCGISIWYFGEKKGFKLSELFLKNG